jgi:hypothetical protein
VKKSVHSWEFWVVVGLLVVAGYVLYLVITALNDGLNNLEQLPGKVANQAGAAAGTLVGAVLGIFGIGTNSNSSNATQGSQDPVYNNGSGSGSGGN